MIELFKDDMTYRDVHNQSNYLLKGGHIWGKRVKSRHDEIVDFLLKDWDNRVLIGEDKEYFPDGFEYTLDTEDLDAEGKPKLVVTGLQGIEKADSVKSHTIHCYKTLVCVADKIDSKAFEVDFNKYYAAEESAKASGEFYTIFLLSELRMPLLDTMPPAGSFSNHVSITGVSAPKLKKIERGKGNYHPKTPDGVPICFKLADIRTADKPFTTIEETASLYSIGASRLRKWVSEEPNHPSLLWVNSKVIIKRKVFEDWLKPLNVFPY